MMAPRGPVFFPAVILTAFVLILVLAHSLSAQGGTARATGGGMDAMSVDMDPSGNTATSIGTREFCARIDRNGEMDGDEDTVDGLMIDVTAGPEGIPANNPMIAFAFTLSYDAGLADIVNDDVDFLLASFPGSDVLDVSDELPDNDGVFNSAALDLNTEPRAVESGPGVLTRITIVPLAAGPAGVHDLVLQGAGHVNAQGVGSAPEVLNHAILAIDTDCPEVQPTPGPIITMTPSATPTATQVPPPTGRGMDAMSVDMDPSGNTATSIGPREFCARINRNGAMDADEDTVDGLTIDVTAGPEGIPADNPMIGFTLALSYDAGLADIVAEDIRFLLASVPGSEVLGVSDDLPDNDGVFNSTALDLTAGRTADSGPGVLTRITIVPVAAAAAGIHDLVLVDGAAAHVNAQNVGAAPEALNHGMLAVDVECPAVQATPGPIITMTPRSTPFRTQGPTPPPRSPPTTPPTATPTFSPVPTLTQGPMPPVVTMAAPAAFPATGGDASVRGGPTAPATAMVLFAFVAAIMTPWFWLRFRKPGKDDGK